jgi:hypothetical protein
MSLDIEYRDEEIFLKKKVVVILEGDSIPEINPLKERIVIIPRYKGDK